ncbi:Glycosyl transferase, family 14-containing protein [Strongyloides ratti]|uniref:Glycosyl transferase, family 14-containing protein n=1 Tax=Strongyloides ratti TaxID=34506 RepID=A0A090LLB3_STRRB|nr:Glycosyl transferase, family 14-containing protein [Strongyloides ratti]CEF70604.1 Glycosyl transferase, family 14-containing protein [Strongyloides ratti]
MGYFLSFKPKIAIQRVKLKKILNLFTIFIIIEWFYNHILFINEYTKQINNFFNYKLINQPFYNHHPLTKNITCYKFFDKTYYFDDNTRISKTTENDTQPLTCELIKKRRYFTPVPLSKEEENFPLAYSFLVYKDYEFLELILSLIYQPQNIYCYAIDKKQPIKFKSKIYLLTSCFKNVFVSDIEYKISSGGLHYGTSHIECIKKIKTFKWKYIFLLQNHDFPLKTNAELVKILKIFKDTSDFKTAKGRKSLLNEKLDWSFKGLKIFKNTSSISMNTLKTTITLGKGYSEVTVSRKAIDYILNALNIVTYQNNFDNFHKYANDELFWSTLFSNYEYLKIPGTLPTHCIHSQGAMKSFTRFTVWNYGKNLDDCPSRYKRHSICIIGIEYINELEYQPHFFVNKMLESFDIGAIYCWGERIFNRTFFPKQFKEIDISPYFSRIQVRFQDFLKKSNDLSEFDCDEI